MREGVQHRGPVVPLAAPGRAPPGEIDWKPLLHHVVLRILHNPRYAGAYLRATPRHQASRRETVPYPIKPREEWISLIPGAHPGYITLDQYDANQQQLTANAAAHGRDRTAGPPREGPALLQGIIICGTCGLRMTVRYHQRCDGSPHLRVPARRHLPRPPDLPGRPRLRPRPADRAAAHRHPHPARHRGRPHRPGRAPAPRRRSRALRAAHVERARYHADLARRRYLAVDPANRLVADTLEADWNTALRALAEAQDTCEQARKHDTGQLTDAQKTQIRPLATDLPAIWNDPATPARERKRIARLLLTDITVTRTRDTITAHIRLPAGQHHTLTVPRPLTAWKPTPPPRRPSP